jgi:hypothetical protein
MITGRVIAVAACGLSLAACSTSLSGLSFMKSTPPTEALRIETDPPGAEAKTALGQSCRTPCELNLDSTSETSLTISLAGHQPQTVSIRPEVAGDPAVSGPKLAPNPVFAQLQPQGTTPAKKLPVRKRPVAAAAPRAAAGAAAAPPPMPASPVEPAASATNYPWPAR